jgi:hypothetical protein
MRMHKQQKRTEYQPYFFTIKNKKMATFEKGILGGFSGKVGSVVGGNWKGIDYMRSRANKRKFTPSQKQLEQQLKFGLMMKFLQPMSALLEVSFSDYAIRKTGINSAFAYNYANAITGAFPDYAIDYSKALVSRGILPNVLGPSVLSGAGSILTWIWTDSGSSSDTKPADQAILVAYCAALKQAIFTTSGGNRSDLTADLNVATFQGQPVETYIGFISEDGRRVAVSIFTGEVTVS